MNPALADLVDTLEAERCRPVPPPPESYRRGPTASWLRRDDNPQPADTPEETR